MIITLTIKWSDEAHLKRFPKIKLVFRNKTLKFQDGFLNNPVSVFQFRFHLYQIQFNSE